MIQAPVGPITNKRVERILQTLGASNAMVLKPEVPPDHAAVIVLPDKLLQIQCFPQQINCGFEGKADAKLDDAAEQAVKVLDALAVEPTRIAARLVAHLMLGESSPGVLGRMLSDKARILGGLLGQPAWGVGLRFFVERGDGHGEYKVEPLIADRSKAYVEYVFESAGPVSSRQFGEYAVGHQATFARLIEGLASALNQQ